jgi:hypothetical protein
MGPAIPGIGEHSPHVGEYVIPADGRRANRKVPRNGLVGSCELKNIPPIGARKKAGILDSGLVNHQMVAGVRFELTTFGL